MTHVLIVWTPEVPNHFEKWVQGGHYYVEIIVHLKLFKIKNSGIYL